MITELTAHVWQSTLFAAAAGLLTVAFRKNRAQVRYWLWFAASLKFFVPFSLLMDAGGHLGWTPAAQKIATPEISFAVERIAQPFPATLQFVPSAPGTVNWTPIVILIVWVCGLLAVGVIRLRLWLRIRACVRASVPLEIAGPRGRPEARVTPGLLEPGVVGMLRPILLMPAGIAERLTPPQLEAVLAHELCHVRRRDNLFASIHMMVEAAFWFHPLVWWIGARLVEERERACDEGVLRLGNEPRIYADAILNVCKLYVASPLVCVSGVTGSNLKKRIEAIMTNRTGQGLNRAKKLLLAGAGVAAVAGPVAIGVVIGIGHAPSVRAQSAVAIPAQIAQAQPAPLSAAAQAATTPAAAGARYRDHRLLAMLFDFDTMTADEQSRAGQSAIRFVRNEMRPADLVSVMAVNGGRVRVAQDFTDDRAVLEAAMLRVSAGAGNGAVRDAGARMASIETAAGLLATIPEKKGLVYFSSGITKPDVENQGGLQRAIDAAKNSNVAIYLVDVRGIVPQNLAQGGRAGGAMAAPPAGPELSPASAMGRTYRRYGPPDQIEHRGSSGQNASQIWRYNYLESFRSHVEFEFTPESGPQSMRINWPRPLATYEGAAAADVAGLPGRHASFQIYPAGELQSLSVPLDALSGPVDIVGEIKMGAQSVAAVRDGVQASAGMFQANFVLPVGSYVCSLVVREEGTGRVYGETIQFEVK